MTKLFKRTRESCRFGALFWIVVILLLWILADTLAVVLPALQAVPEIESVPTTD